MWSRPWALLLPFYLLGSAATAQTLGVEVDVEGTLALSAELEEAPLGGYVAVWRNAPVFLTAADARAFSEPVELLSPLAAHVVAFRVVEDGGEVVRVMTVAEHAAHCLNVSTEEVFFEYEFELWVRREHLAPVLAEPFEERYGDGSFVALRPGLAVVRDEAGRLRAAAPSVLSIAGWLLHYALPIAVPAGSVALSYQPGEPVAALSHSTSDGASDRRLAEVQLGEAAVRLPSDYTFAPEDTDSTELPDGPARYRVSRPCFEMGVRARAVPADSTATPSLAELSSICAESVRVDAGTVVYSSAGEAVGRALEPLSLCASTPTEVGDLVCFERHLSRYASGQLCHRIDEVERNESLFGDGGSLADVFGGVGEIGIPPTSDDAETPAVVTRDDFDREAIRTVVAEHREAIRSCYASVLAQEPTARGRVTTEISVGPEGQVTDASVVSSDVPAVDACLLAEIRRMQFPEPDSGAAVVRYPFVFEPAE